MTNFEKIFTSIKFGTLELPNRIVMSPMVTHYATDNGTVTQRVIDYYTARAAGGVGLITVEATFVDRKSLEHHMLGIYDDKMVPGLKKLAAAIHAAGGRASIQLIHKGRLAKSATTTMRTVSASNEPDMGDPPCPDRPRDPRAGGEVRPGSTPRQGSWLRRRGNAHGTRLHPEPVPVPLFQPSY